MLQFGRISPREPAIMTMCHDELLQLAQSRQPDRKSDL
jgi:hypothetical protein